MSIANYRERPLKKYYPSLFDDIFFNDFWETTNGAKGSMPATNIEELDHEFKLDMAVPGMSKEDIKVEVKNGILSISAEKEESSEEEKKNYTKKEYNYNSFERSFSLPENVEEAVSAKYEDGILHISIPKKKVEVSNAKQIKVS